MSDLECELKMNELFIVCTRVLLHLKSESPAGPLLNLYRKLNSQSPKPYLSSLHYPFLLLSIFTLYVLTAY